MLSFCAHLISVLFSHELRSVYKIEVYIVKTSLNLIETRRRPLMQICT